MSETPNPELEPDTTAPPDAEPDTEPDAEPDDGREPEESGSDSDGQVSEVGGLGTPGTPVSDGDAVHGNPSDQSGDPDVGPAGPDARPSPGRDDRDRPHDPGLEDHLP